MAAVANSHHHAVRLAVVRRQFHELHNSISSIEDQVFRKMADAPSKVEPFVVEQWMDEYETKATLNLGETCIDPMSLKEVEDRLRDRAGSIIDLSKPMNYGEIRGSKTLRSHLAWLFSVNTPQPLSYEQVLITPGGIAANYLVFYSLIGQGDHVVCQYPTYQQLYSVPQSLGADVSLWKADETRDWQLDFADLRSMMRKNTKMIVLNNPTNPTGAVISKSMIQRIVSLARERNIIIVCDEVYRPIFHGITPADPEFPPSILSFGYDKTIAVGSMSKAWSLAGVRLGWLASRSQALVEACAEARHYTTISVGLVNDQIASYVLNRNNIDVMIERNLDLVNRNLGILANFINAHSSMCSWVYPKAGTTAFVKFTRNGRPVDDVTFCKMLIADTGVLLVPGSHCFGFDEDFQGYIRVGYCCSTKVLEDGLQALSRFLARKLEIVPVMRGVNGGTN